MSIFSSIKRARQTTKEQNSRSSEKKKSVSPSPYRHIPTHAASDAIGVAPPADRNKDKSKVREENRKRSAMAAAHAHAHHMNMPGNTRGGSGYTSSFYPSGDVSPMSAGTPNPYGRSGYPSSDTTYSHPPSVKGKEVDRAHYYDMAAINTSSSKGGREPVASSRNSVGSAEVLDSRRSSRPASERPSSTSRHPHRLHPTSRRTSDSSIDRERVNNTLAAATMTSQARETRPPPSTRGRGNLKPLPIVPPTQSQPPASSSGRGHSSRHSSREVSARRDSSSSLPILTPSSTRPTSSTPATPTSRRIIVNKAEFTMVTPGRPPSLNFDFEFSGQETPTQARPNYHNDGRRSSRYSGYSGHSLVDSSVEKLDFGLRRKSRNTPSPLPPDQSNGYMNGYHINAYDMNNYYHEGYYQDPREAPSPPSKPSSKDRSSKDRSSKERSSRRDKDRKRDKDKKEEKEGRSRRLSLTKAGSKLKKRWSASK